MVVLVGDAEFCNEVESLELFTSSCEAQDLLFDLGWMLKEHTLDANVLIQRLQLLLNYANEKGWERVAERILEAAERQGVLHKLVGAFDISSLDWRNILTESNGHPASYTLPSLASPELNRSHLIPSLAQSEVCPLSFRNVLYFMYMFWSSGMMSILKCCISFTKFTSHVVLSWVRQMRTSIHTS